MTAQRKILTPAAAVQMARAMEQSPRTLDDLVALSELSRQTVTRYVKSLQESGIAQVGGWLRDRRGYPTIRQFVVGTEADVPCPRMDETPARRMKRIRAARKVAAQ